MTTQSTPPADDSAKPEAEHLRPETTLAKFSRPENVAPRLWGQFVGAFERGIEMWTSEDGMITAIAILPYENAKEVLLWEYGHRIKEWDDKKLRLVNMEHAWDRGEYFEPRRRGKIWSETNSKTGMEALIYELY